MNPDVQRAWRTVMVENARLCAAWSHVQRAEDRDRALREWRDAMDRRSGALARYLWAVSDAVNRLRW